MPTEPQDPKLWVTEAAPEEQGNFCDTSSGNHYGNSDALNTEVQIQNAIASGTEPVIVDDRSDNLDARYNLLETEDDSQGLSTPIHYGPGR